MRFLDKCNRLHIFFKANDCLETITSCVFAINLNATDCKKEGKNYIVSLIILIIDNNL